jgi:gamma-glutamylcyclotransferase (GGCT)/AIG2-like uncharacterized protein YtfP
MSDAEKILPVFVYGTLRRGEKNYARYLQGRTLREVSATVAGGLYFAAEGGYPYLLAEGGGEMVVGELMYLDPVCYGETLRSLDLLEEYDCVDEAGSVYLRRRGTVIVEGGKTTTAWIYYWNGPGAAGRRIIGGDFRKRGGS